MTDNQPPQPLTDAELESYRQGFSGPYDGHVIRLLDEVDRLRSELADVDVAVKDTGIMSTGAQGVRDMRLHFAQALQDNRVLRAQLAAEKSGSHIAMDAGVSYLQEVKRLEMVCADLKEINDRMAEDRLRLIDQRDSILADLLQYSQLHWEDCPLDAEDCYLCEGYERIRANAADRKRGKAPNQ